jgi:hypothetical protein
LQIIQSAIGSGESKPWLSRGTYENGSLFQRSVSGFSPGAIARRDMSDRGYPLSMCVHLIRKRASPLHRHLRGLAALLRCNYSTGFVNMQLL